MRRLARADAHRSAQHAVGRLLQTAGCPVPLLDERADRLQEQTSGAGQAHAVPHALEETRAELALELLHGHRDRRLRAIEAPGGRAEAAFAGDGEKNAGLLDLHGLLMSLISEIESIDLTAAKRRRKSREGMAKDRQEPGSDLHRDRIEDSIRRGLAAYREGDLAAAAQRARRGAPGTRSRDAGALGAPRQCLLRDGAISSAPSTSSSGSSRRAARRRGPRNGSRPARGSSTGRPRSCVTARRPSTSARTTRRCGASSASRGVAPEDCAEAVTALREAVRLDAEDAAGAGIELGSALRELGDREGAAGAYREALARRPDRSDLWSDLASLYSEMGRFAESDQAVREAIRLKPTNASAWHTIATNTLKQGERDTAQRAYQRMKELNPDFADEILSWVSNTSGLPRDTVGEPVLAAAAGSGRQAPRPPPRLPPPHLAGPRSVTRRLRGTRSADPRPPAGPSPARASRGDRPASCRTARTRPRRAPGRRSPRSRAAPSSGRRRPAPTSRASIV